MCGGQSDIWRASKHIGDIQTYGVSKQMGASEHMGVSKHIGGIQMYGASECIGGHMDAPLV